MKKITNKYILYGLDKHKEVIDEIISDINDDDKSFDVRLMLTEALTNAFKHGNKSNEDKPIYLRTTYNEESMKFEIKDCGTGFEDITIAEQIPPEKLLDNYGRGLFIIKCIADNIEIRNNTLTIVKKFNEMKEVLL